MIRRPPRPPIKMMQPIALDLANSVTLLTFHSGLVLCICSDNVLEFSSWGRALNILKYISNYAVVCRCKWSTLAVIFLHRLNFISDGAAKYCRSANTTNSCCNASFQNNFATF